MNIIFRIIPAIALCAGLTACGESNTSTTTTTDTAALNSVPIDAAASDSNGAGMDGASTNMSNSAAAPSGSMGSMNSSSGNGNDAASTPDRTNGRNQPGTRITAEDSVNNRTGLAPVK